MEKNMGDRGNILVVDEIETLGGDHLTIGTVFIYSHWHGSSLAQMLRAALKREKRWGDASYLTRIIFDTVSEAHVNDKDAGLGISSVLGDNEWGRPIIVVRPYYKKIGLWYPNRDELDTYLRKPGNLDRSYPFGRFIAPLFQFNEAVELA